MVGLNMGNTDLTTMMNSTEDDQNQSGLEDDVEDKKLDLMKLTKETFAIPHSVNELKANLSNIASMLNLQVKPIDSQDMSYASSMTVDIKSVKKHFMDHMDKEKIQKLKKIMKMKNCKRKKQEFKSVVAECGLSEELLRSLFKNKSKSRDDLRHHKKSLRIRAHERQQKLLEMAESLKRSKGYSGSTVVVSKLGNKKISLHKSSVSIFSYQTHFLTSDNLEDAAEVLSGRMNKYGRHCDKLVDKKTMSTPKCQHLKRKIRHLVNRISKEINESGYRITFSSTIGSDVEFHSAELSVIPIKVDELFPEVKDDPKLEMSEDDYAKHLERQHFIEKQKANQDRMKELELQLTQILSGVDEVLVTKRKRYGLGSSKPTDAERMKQFRKKLKEDPSKYQEYRQKRALTTKKRRLITLASKMKDSSTSGITSTNVNEENHNAPSLSLPQTVTSVNIHCPPGYVLPSSHQAPTPTVNLLNTAQYVAQVPGMQPTHQHQQTLPYTGEMDIVELIAATHNVQNQHFA